jgi:hypothetical protein
MILMFPWYSDEFKKFDHRPPSPAPELLELYIVLVNRLINIRAKLRVERRNSEGGITVVLENVVLRTLFYP